MLIFKQIVFTSGLVILLLLPALVNADDPPVYEGTNGNLITSYVCVTQENDGGGLTVRAHAVVASINADGEVSQERVSTHDSYDRASRAGDRAAHREAQSQLNDQKQANNKEKKGVWQKFLSLFRKRDKAANSVMAFPDGQGDMRTGPGPYPPPGLRCLI